MLLLILACMGDAPIKDIPHESGGPSLRESDSMEDKAPVITLIAPQEGQVVAASFHLSLLVQDDLDSADQLSVEINESGSILTGGFVSSDGTFEVELGPFTEGEHLLTLLARDHTGQEGQLEMRVYVGGGESPTVVWEEPVDGFQTTASQPLHLRALISDDASTELLLSWHITSEIDAQSYSLFCSERAAIGEVSCDSPILAGLWTVLLNATDDNGGIGSAYIVHLNVLSDSSVDADGDGMSADEGDCDDNNPAVFLGNSESCDGLDNDCNGEVDENAPGAIYVYQDLDEDGFGDSTQPEWHCQLDPGFSQIDGDCDDLDDDVFPGATEFCDSEDQDCNGLVDDNAVDQLSWYIDRDGDGFGGTLESVGCSGGAGTIAVGGDCQDRDSQIYPLANEVCDGVDNDCDGVADGANAIDILLWYRDVDGDGYGDINQMQYACTQPLGYVADGTDCIDLLSIIYPGATETCNLIDDDCNGVIDDNAINVPVWYLDGDGDGYGLTLSTQTTCQQPTGYVAVDGDCDDNDASIHPNAGELCTVMGIDEDCDGLIDETPAIGETIWWYDADADGYGDPNLTPITSCTQPAYTISNSDDCDDQDAMISPVADELCDGVDNNCNGTIDDGC